MGMLTFMSDYMSTKAASAPVEKLSVYRFFDDEIFAMDDDGTFGWHNGAFRSTNVTVSCLVHKLSVVACDYFYEYILTGCLLS